MFKSTEDTCPVHVEDGGEVVGVPVKEILGRVPGGELVTQLQHLLDGLGPHQLAQPGHGVTCHVSRVTRLHLVAGKTARMSRVAMNLSPPTSRITVLLSLASAASLLLTPGTWRRDILTRDT